MPKRIDQTVYYCDICNHHIIPEGVEAANVKAIAKTHIQLDNTQTKIEINNDMWGFSCMNTFKIPFFAPKSSVVAQNSFGSFEVDVRNFLNIKEVYLCQTCAEKHGQKYLELIDSVTKWAENVGLL